MKINNKTVFIIGAICLFLLFVLFVVDIIVLRSIDVVDIIARIVEIVLSASAAATISLSVSIDVKVSDNDMSHNRNKDGLLLKDAHGNQIGFSPSFNILKPSKNGVSIINVGQGMKEFLEYYNETLVPQQIKNMEDIARKTFEEASKNPSEKEIDKDFVMKYIEESRNISDEDIQDIWVKLLVHGSKKGKGVSKRTLDIIKNMTSQEAKTFEKIASLALNETIIPKSFKGDYDWLSMSLLQDIGLVKAGDFTVNTINIPAGVHLAYHNNNTVIAIENTGAKEIPIEIECQVLTSEGAELKEALSISISDENIIKFATKLKEKNKNSYIKIKAHRIKSVSGRSISYEGQIDLLS